MGDIPRSLREFEARFPDDRACARWLVAKRWPDGFRCPACGHGHGWELGRGTLVIECAKCHRQTSVTAGTVLHRSHLPLKVWFLAAWLVATHRRSEEHTSELQSRQYLVCRLLLEKKKNGKSRHCIRLVPHLISRFHRTSPLISPGSHHLP